MLAAEAEAKLSAYGWPGNVRELVNLCRRMTVLAPGSEVRAEDLPPEVGSARAHELRGCRLGQGASELGRPSCNERQNGRCSMRPSRSSSGF